ncbi:hypothetical protein WJX81_000574 [Elliptochloris bilobata]|uniref:Fructose-bisphosphatase n=1 Tax=Elliptochloris bilobata TaxID=381761 RepID=A0AAW1SJN0_9CHLO
MASGGLQEQLSSLEPKLARVLLAIADAVAEIAVVLRGSGHSEVGTANAFGDKQLQADVAADAVVLERLRQCGAVETASSEERPELVPLGGRGYSVAWDPLDGSSILAAGWAVGAIFGVWPGAQLLGRCGQEQSAAAYAVFGPRTILVLARPLTGAGGGGPRSCTVQEFVLGEPRGAGATWALARSDVRIGEKQVFAPANLRAAAEHEPYRRLVDAMVAERYTLRYSGGLVPDIHHILAKGGGVFVNPVLASAPAKLRVLYEVLPLAFVVEAAGGASTHDGRGSALRLAAGACDARSAVALGSPLQVDRACECMAPVD